MLQVFVCVFWYSFLFLSLCMQDVFEHFFLYCRSLNLQPLAIPKPQPPWAPGAQFLTSTVCTALLALFVFLFSLAYRQPRQGSGSSSTQSAIVHTSHNVSTLPSAMSNKKCSRSPAMLKAEDVGILAPSIIIWVFSEVVASYVSYWLQDVVESLLQALPFGFVVDRCSRCKAAPK